MAYIQSEAVALTTTAGGAATGFTPVVTGYVRGIRYSGGFDATADITITGEDTGQPIVTLTDQADAVATLHPRQATHDVVGAASLYAAAGEPVESDIPLAGERIKVVVAQGGNVETGTLTFWIG